MQSCLIVNFRLFLTKFGAFKNPTDPGALVLRSIFLSLMAFGALRSINAEQLAEIDSTDFFIKIAQL